MSDFVRHLVQPWSVLTEVGSARKPRRRSGHSNRRVLRVSSCDGTRPSRGSSVVAWRLVLHEEFLVVVAPNLADAPAELAAPLVVGKRRVQQRVEA